MLYKTAMMQVGSPDGSHVNTTMASLGRSDNRSQGGWGERESAQHSTSGSIATKENESYGVRVEMDGEYADTIATECNSAYGVEMDGEYADSIATERNSAYGMELDKI